MPPCPLHLPSKPLHLAQRQIVLCLAHNPDYSRRPSWVDRPAKDVDRLNPTVPALPGALQHPYLPAELSLQHIVQDDRGDIFDITSQRLTEPPHLAGELLQGCFCPPLGCRQLPLPL